jgi:hypothetical protein
MFHLLRALVVLAVGLAPAPSDSSTQAEAPASGSRVHPYGLPAEGWLGPTFEGPWRFRIALNGWMPNEVLVTVDTGDSRETVEEDLGWLLTNMEYYFNWDDTISLIDAGLSYELGRWPLTGDPAGPEVTVEPSVGARIMREPLPSISGGSVRPAISAAPSRRSACAPTGISPSTGTFASRATMAASASTTTIRPGRRSG